MGKEVFGIPGPQASKISRIRETWTVGNIQIMKTANSLTTESPMPSICSYSFG